MEVDLIIEALLFTSGRPMAPGEIGQILRDGAATVEGELEKQVLKDLRGSTEDIEERLDRLKERYEELDRSFRLICVAGKWQFVNRVQYEPWLRVLLGEKPLPARLSQPALETLAIVACRQPVTRAEMEHIRGVSVDGVLQTLIERGLVEAVGRSAAVGRPVTFGTTPFFLEYFGLRNLEDFPAFDELKRLPLETDKPLEEEDPAAPSSASSGQTGEGVSEGGDLVDEGDIDDEDDEDDEDDIDDEDEEEEEDIDDDEDDDEDDEDEEDEEDEE